jgi:hypothetical protein
MLVIRSNRATASTNGTATYDPTKDFKDVIEKARDGRTHTMAEYEALGKKFPNSAIKLAADSQRAGMTMTSTDYASLLSEMKSLFDTLNADNQVQQVRAESMQNVRSNMLDGISSMLKSYRDEISSVRRNLGK